MKEDFISAWHLTEMTNVNGDKITFHYLETNPITHKHFSEKRVKVQDSRLYEYLPEYVRNSTSITYKQLLIDRIESKFAIVHFRYGIPSSTSYASATLRSIEVFAPSDTVTPVKTFTLNYDSKGELLRVTENGENLCTFTYYNIDFTETGIDFGGYYNATSGGTRLPYVNSNYGGGTADRSVNPNVADAGNLRACPIIYVNAEVAYLGGILKLA